MEIKTVEDYIKYSNAVELEYCFKSKIPINSKGSTIYSIVEKPSNGDKDLHIRPLNGRNLKKDLSETVHVPLWQHLSDRISQVPRDSIC